MLFETNKDKGRAGLALGIAWFGANGYSVNIPLNDTQWYDFVAEKDSKFYSYDGFLIMLDWLRQANSRASQNNRKQFENIL